MRGGWLWLGGIGAAALVWAAAPELPWPARVFTAILLGPAPVGFVMQAGSIDMLPRPLPKMPLYLGTIAGLWLLAALAILAAMRSSIPARLIGLYLPNVSALVLWTAFGLLAAAAVVMVFKALGYRDPAVMHDIIPVTLREQAVFVALSVSAGICEELTFRGFLLTALMVATGSTVLAVLLSSVVFGLMHAHQGAGGALRAAGLGAVLCVPVLLTGSLYPSMAAHALTDIAGGLWLARWLLR